MNFALIMFSLLVVTGLVCLLDHFVLRKHRAADAPEPWWIEYPKSFFPVILIVFLLRSRPEQKNNQNDREETFRIFDPPWLGRICRAVFAQHEVVEQAYQPRNDQQ